MKNNEHSAHVKQEKNFKLLLKIKCHFFYQLDTFEGFNHDIIFRNLKDSSNAINFKSTNINFTCFVFFTMVT